MMVDFSSFKKLKLENKLYLIILFLLPVLLTLGIILGLASQKSLSSKAETPLASGVIEVRGIFRVKNTESQDPISGAKVAVYVQHQNTYKTAPCPPQEGSVNQTTTGRDGLFSFKCDWGKYTAEYPDKSYIKLNPVEAILVRKTFLPDGYFEGYDNPWCCDRSRNQDICPDPPVDDCDVNQYDEVSFKSLNKNITGMITFYGRVPGVTLTPTPPPTACKSPMDVVFIFDNSANMNNSLMLGEIKKHAPDIIDRLELASNGDYRVGIASFKKGKKFVDLNLGMYSKRGINNKISSVIYHFSPYHGRMQDPEPSDLALEEVLKNKTSFPWRDEAEKMIILFTAVPPGGEDGIYVTGTDDIKTKALADEAARQNIRISSILTDYQPTEEKIMKYYSMKTKGIFIQLENGWRAGDFGRFVEIIDHCGKAGGLLKDCQRDCNPKADDCPPPLSCNDGKCQNKSCPRKNDCNCVSGCQEACDVEGNNYGKCGYGLKCTNLWGGNPGWCVNEGNSDSPDCWYLPNSSLSCNEGRWYIPATLVSKNQTFEFWVRPDGRPPNSNAVVFQKCSVGGITIKIVTDLAGVSRFKLIFGGDNKTISSAPITADGLAWTHLAFTKTFKSRGTGNEYDKYDVRFYVNGQLQGVQRDAAYSTSVSDRCNFVFANKDDNFIPEQGFNGSFQDFRFSEGIRKITANWKANHYKCCLTADNTTKILLNLDGNYKNQGRAFVSLIGFDRYQAWGENYGKGCRFTPGRQCSLKNSQPTPTWAVTPLSPAVGAPIDW